MYNGIGLTTPRGSGTNGHVQRNWALVRPREKDRSYRTEDELAALDTAANKQPNKDILDHDRKRKIELKCAEFADILEEQGYSEGAITNKVNNYRNMLLNHDGKLDKAVDQWGRPSVTETHQVAEAQQEKNAKLREAFGISEYFVDGSSFDPDREAKEQVARSNALLERERQQQLDKAQAQQYDLVQTPSPEPEAQQPDVEAERKKSKKRKHKDSTSSEEVLSSKKKKKSKKRNKKERSEKSKDKKAKKKRKRSSKASSDESEDTGGTSNDETTSDEERKKRKRKKKEKKKLLKKKQVSSKSSSSRDSSPETRKQKPSPKSKELDKNDSKSTSSKIDYHRRDSHDEDRRGHSHSPPAHRGRDRRSRSREKESNYRAYNSRRRSPKEKPQFSPKKTDRYKTKYELTSKNSRDQSDPPPRHTRSRSPSSEHERRTRSRKHNNGRSVDNRQHRSKSRDKRSRSMSPRISKRNDSRYSPVHRSRSKSIGRRSSSVENRKKKRNRSKSSAEKIIARPYSKRSRSDSVERPSIQKSRRSDSKSPEVLRLRSGVLKEGRRSISRDERIDDPYTNSTKRSGRANRVSPKLQNERDRSLSLEIISRRSNTSSPRNNAYSYRPSGSQDQNKHTKLSSRHRSKSVERRQEYSRSSSMKIQQQESSLPYEKKKRSASPKQIQSKKSTAAEEYYKSHSKKGSEETVLARLLWHAKSAPADTRNRSISIEDRLRSKDFKSDKHIPDRYSPRDVSTSPERKGSYKNQEQKKKDSMVHILSKINDDASHKAMDSMKRKSSSNRTSSRDKSSSPDYKYTTRTETLKQKIVMEEVLSKINDDRTQRVAVTESMLSKSFKDISRSPDSKSSKSFDYDKQKSLMEEVLSKINTNKSTFRDLKQSSSQTERFNKYRTPSPDPKSVRNTEVVKQKNLMDEVVSKINDISKSAKSTTPPRSSRNSESEKHKKTAKSITKTREQKPVVCLRATSDDENSNSGNEHEENAELIENEMRVLRMLKSDLAAKAKESLERKRVSKKETPSPKKSIDPNTFDIQGPPRETAILEKVCAQLFPSYDNLVKETRKGSVRDSSSKSPMKKSKDKSRSPSVESRSRSRKSSKIEERKSRSRSKTKRKSRKSVSSSSASSYSSGHRSSSSSSSSSDSSRSSRSRSRSSSGSRSSSTSSRSRSPSIPRRHGSPSFLDRRRITRK